MLPQSTLTIVTPIQPAEAAMVGLRDVLTEIVRDPAANPLVPFGDLPGLHYGRFVILEGAVDPGSGRIVASSLAFNCCVDGPADQFLESLMQKMGTGLWAVFQHCSGAPAPGEHANLLAWLRRHRIPTPLQVTQSGASRGSAPDGRCRLRSTILRRCVLAGFRCTDGSSTGTGVLAGEKEGGWCQPEASPSISAC